jgi:hypothetical protein
MRKRRTGPGGSLKGATFLLRFVWVLVVIWSEVSCF